jgi:hypothetical protein
MNRTKLETPLLDTKQAAEYLDVSPLTLRNWRLRGEGPAATKIGRLVKYHIRELEKYIAIHTEKTA